MRPNNTGAIDWNDPPPSSGERARSCATPTSAHISGGMTCTTHTDTLAIAVNTLVAVMATGATEPDAVPCSLQF